MQFIDEVKIIIRSGKGGDGCVSFRREKYVPNGGPDGGDGGDGGSVVFKADPGLNSLSDFRRGKRYVAQNGEDGKGSRCHGKRGEDLIIKVPAGTVIRDEATGKVIADISADDTQITILPGGKGGLGNQHFATSRMQAPKYAKAGGDAIELPIILELKLIADVGLVGFPNAGKSTLLSCMSNARPKIADYPFTTLTPMLGVVDLKDGESFVMADIPGLIEGAADGVGLGHDFLRHIERNRMILHVVDAFGTDGREPVSSINAINEELEAFSTVLAHKPKIIVLNKTDLGDYIPVKKEIEDTFGCKTVCISAASMQGIDELKYEIANLLKTLPRDTYVFENEINPIEAFVSSEGYEITVNKDGEYVIEGPKIEKMLGYTNLESEKGFLFFTKFLKEQGIIKELESMGISEGDTVRMYGHTFDYYK